MKRYSKNREAILDCLRRTKTHPTAEWVYEQLKPDCPSISLATVYRNLIALQEEGVICSVGISGGKEHFDSDTVPHAHAVCVVCGRIIDLPGIELPEALAAAVRSASDFSISGSVQFPGICPDCRRNKEKKESYKNETEKKGWIDP